MRGVPSFLGHQSAGCPRGWSDAKARLFLNPLPDRLLAGPTTCIPRIPRHAKLCKHAELAPHRVTAMPPTKLLLLSVLAEDYSYHILRGIRPERTIKRLRITTVRPDPSGETGPGNRDRLVLVATRYRLACESPNP